MLGTVTLNKYGWQVTCEPHVRARLKRTFAQSDQRAANVVTITNSPENCRDLLWFLDRYPMSVDPLHVLETGAASHKEQETLVSRLLDRRDPPADFELAVPARAYQREAATLAVVKRGLLVADDVGLGKTVTAICPMAMQEHLPALVVTLTHLPAQWQAEIHRFAPQLKVHILKSGKPYDLAPNAKGLISDDHRMPDVIISNYHKLNGWAETLKGIIRYVVFDEVQELRRPDSYKYTAAEHIAEGSILRMGLSATPIYNMGSEFYSVLNILLPGALGTQTEFNREWCGGSLGKLGSPKVFGSYLRSEGIMIRRTRADVQRELPGLTKIPHVIGSDSAALDKIKGNAIELAKIILSAAESARGQKLHATEEFNVLMRQATGIAKAPYVAQFIKILAESEDKIVVFAWHREVYNILMEQLASLNPLLYTGTETPKKKSAAVEAFITGDCRVLLISLRAGAGLDGLQKACRTIVHAELDWSPGVMDQCDGRVNRDGQAHPVMSYYLLSEDGVDPIISDVLGIKRSQIEGVRDPEAALVEALNTDTGNVKRLAAAYLAGLHIAAGFEEGD